MIAEPTPRERLTAARMHFLLLYGTYVVKPFAGGVLIAEPARGAGPAYVRAEGDRAWAYLYDVVVPDGR